MLRHQFLYMPANLTRLFVLLLFGRYEESLADFQRTLKELRGNQLIDYGALGLRYKLNTCEVSTAFLIPPPPPKELIDLHIVFYSVKVFKHKSTRNSVICTKD